MIALEFQGVVVEFWAGADVAQLVEQRIRNAKVVSSIPIVGTIPNLTRLLAGLLVLAS